MTDFPAVPPRFPDSAQHRQLLAERINEISRGKTNNTALWTLSPGVSATEFLDERIGVETQLVFTPTTANAAAELAAGGLYVSETDRRNGVAVVNHADNMQTDRVFRVSLIG